MRWKIDSGYPFAGREIQLLTLNQLFAIKACSPEAELISVRGERVKVKDCDTDTRNGYVSYGQMLPLTGLDIL